MRPSFFLSEINERFEVPHGLRLDSQYLYDACHEPSFEEFPPPIADTNNAHIHIYADSIFMSKPNSKNGSYHYPLRDIKNDDCNRSGSDVYACLDLTIQGGAGLEDILEWLHMTTEHIETQLEVGRSTVTLADSTTIIMWPGNEWTHHSYYGSCITPC